MLEGKDTTVVWQTLQDANLYPFLSLGGPLCLKNIEFFIIFVCIGVFPTCLCTQNRPEEGMRYPRAGVTMWDAGNRTWVL